MTPAAMHAAAALFAAGAALLLLGVAVKRADDAVTRWPNDTDQEDE